MSAGRSAVATVLCVGDLHLGRAPTRVPDAALDGSGLARPDLAPAAAWLRTARAAVERDVDALVLLGDVVDERNALLEASGPFARGVAMLREAGIPVVAVVGNHDVEELPRLVDSTDGVELLGRGGQWQSLIVGRPGRAQVRLVGWSFPTARVTASPLHSMDPRMRAGAWDSSDSSSVVATLGLLHCDLDVAGSHHAPVRRVDLDAVPVDAWLLGHIHKAAALDEARPTGYLGSLAPLDPGEPEWHGAWLAHCSTGAVRMERLPVAVHRYERMVLDISTLASAGDILGALGQLQRAHRAELGSESDALRVVVGRLELVGSSPHHAAVLETLAADGGLDAHVGEHGGVRYCWEPRVRDRARPAIDLDALAASNDIAAPLASLVQADAGSADVDRALFEAVRATIERDVLARPAFYDQALAAQPLDDAALRELVLTAAGDVLEAVAATRTGGLEASS